MAEIKRRPVRILREDVARRIAAGEVIDKPAAIVRELMDNAVDSGATSINVEIVGGGIELVKVSDNGAGMTRDDLENCANPHATSKIVEAEDLSKLTTLGFRGEALASIAAVGTLSISSGNLKMTLSNSSPRKIEEIPVFQDGKGTAVSGADIFADFPARRVFLKRPASETMMCKDIFVEKAIARPDIAFRLTVDNSLRLDLPTNVSKAQRFISALGLKEDISLFHELQLSGKESDGKNDWKFSIVIGDPMIRKNDRRSIFIYVNGRRIQEYSLLQAIEYGCQGFFPNGTHPVAVLFANVNPELVDFNIHPAKKEVKFRDITALHHGVSSSLRAFFRSLTQKQNNEFFENEEDKLEIQKEDSKNEESILVSVINDEKEIFKENNEIKESQENIQSELKISDSQNSSNKIENISKEIELPVFQQDNQEKTDLRSRFFNFDTSFKTQVSNELFSKNEDDSVNKEIKPQKNEEIKFLGRTMETFIILERRNILYFIDQHAAHERILFDEMMENLDKYSTGKQNLLIPYKIETEDDAQEKYLENLLEYLEKAGFSGKKTSEGIFEFYTTPTRWTGTQKDFQDAILDKVIEPSRIMYKILATTACRKAIMQGTYIDDKTAEDIAKKALALSDAHCPHGRPIWFTMTKEQMFAKVRRTEN